MNTSGRFPSTRLILIWKRFDRSYLNVSAVIPTGIILTEQGKASLPTSNMPDRMRWIGATGATSSSFLAEEMFW